MVWGAIAGAAISAAGSYLTNKSNQKAASSGKAGTGTGGIGADTTAEATRMKDAAAEQQLRMATEDIKRDMYYQPLLNGLKKASEAYQKMGNA